MTIVPNTKIIGAQILKGQSIEILAENIRRGKESRLNFPGYEFYCNEKRFMDTSRKLSDIEVIGIRLANVDAKNFKRAFSLTRSPRKNVR